MISRIRYGRAGLLLLAAGFGVASVLPAGAQMAPSNDGADNAAMENAAPDTGDDLRDLELDWSQLNVDASTLIDGPASKLRLSPQAGTGTEMSWSSRDKPNGSSAVSLKQPLSPFWDTRIGADLTVVQPPQTLTSADLLRQKILNENQPSQSSGSAWAAITAPGVGSIWDKTAVEARVDPAQEQSKLGTSMSKSLPLSEQYSLALRNGYNVIQQGIVPVPGIPGRPARNYETEQSARLDNADTGTSLIAGQTLSSSDDKWLRRIGAEQRLFGGVTINGSIGETPQGTANKSLTAGFKRSW